MSIWQVATQRLSQYLKAMKVKNSYARFLLRANKMQFFILAVSFLSAVSTASAATVSVEQALEAGQLLTAMPTRVLEDRAPVFPSLFHET